MLFSANPNNKFPGGITMARSLSRAAACAAALSLHLLAAAQQPATPAATAPVPPPPPAFAASDLSAAGVRALASNCAACHGTQGKSQPGAAVPGLAGRPKESLVIAMQEFKDGKRTATLMHQIAKGYSAEEIAAMGDYFANQKP
jgi:cytochrome subunit of sulfide dehydrogenase